MNHEQIIQIVTSKVLNIPEKNIKIVSRLMGGMSNYTYIIQANDDKYTFRIPGKNAEKYGADLRGVSRSRCLPPLAAGAPLPLKPWP